MTYLPVSFEQVIFKRYRPIAFAGAQILQKELPKMCRSRFNVPANLLNDASRKLSIYANFLENIILKLHNENCEFNIFNTRRSIY